MSQHFERWGSAVDHDDLTLEQDIKRVGELHEAGLTTLFRAGGVNRRLTSDPPDPAVCGTGLAAALIAATAPGLSFFSCEPSFASGVDPSTGWMTLLEAPEYSKPLGAPLGPPTIGPNGLTRRSYSGGATAILNVTSDKGCVRWKDGSTSGTCPGPSPCCTKCSVECAEKECTATELEVTSACNCGGHFVASNHSWAQPCNEMCRMNAFCTTCDHSC